MNNENANTSWTGPVPCGADSMKFSVELWEYFNTAEAASGLKSSMGAQIEQLGLGAVTPDGQNTNTGPEGAQLAAIGRFRKTWAKLRLLPGSVQESLSRFYGGGDVSEFEAVSAHKRFFEAVAS